MNPSSDQRTALPSSGVPVPLASSTKPSLTGSPPSETQNTSVLHLINGEHFSGAERVQDLLGLHLPNFGYKPGFACVKPDRFPQMRTAREAPLYELGMHSRFDFRVVTRLARIVRDECYELLHAHTPRTAMLGSLVARNTDCPLVYHVHSPVSRDSTRRWQNWINVQVENFSLKHVDHLITVSHSLATHMEREGVSEQRMTVVPNGVPVNDRRRSRIAPQASWTLGAVALFRPRKGTEILLQTLAELRSQGRDVKLRAVGPFESDAYGDQLKALAKKLGLEEHVVWTGFTRDVTAELLQMDLFVLPSLFGEGLPMVVLEAMATGVPVVATRVEGVPEAIHHGQNGVLAAPNDAADLAKVIGTVLKGEFDWSELQVNGFQRHRDSFSDVAMARGVAAVYDRLRQSRSPAHPLGR